MEYSANEAGLTFCYTSVDDKISSIVENQIYIIFEDGSESEITDTAKVETIEMILNESAFAMETLNYMRSGKIAFEFLSRIAKLSEFYYSILTIISQRDIIYCDITR